MLILVDEILMLQTAAIPDLMTPISMIRTETTIHIVSFSPVDSLVPLVSPFYVPEAPQDTDSDVDVYGQRYAPSSESLGPPGPGNMGNSDSSVPTFVDYAGVRDAYPAWSAERQIPLSKEEIEDIFLDLTQKFGFQRDSMRNMVSALLSFPPDTGGGVSVRL